MNIGARTDVGRLKVMSQLTKYGSCEHDIMQMIEQILTISNYSVDCRLSLSKVMIITSTLFSSTLNCSVKTGNHAGGLSDYAFFYYCNKLVSDQ